MTNRPAWKSRTVASVTHSGTRWDALGCWDDDGGGFGFWNHNGEDLNATLINVTIENNVAQQGWFIGYGGGVWANNSSTVFENCSFINNISNNNGGAVNYWGGSSSPEFYHTTFDGNSATANGGAIYIAPDAAGFKVEYCTFVNNSTANGNGAAIQTNHPGTVINSTFYGNTATGDAGTLGIGDYVFVDVYNSIFWNEDVTYEISGYASYSTLYHSLVQPMGDDSYDGLWNTGGFGNIDVDPLLTNPSEGDYTFTSDSPCKDAGIADLDGDGVEDNWEESEITTQQDLYYSGSSVIENPTTVIIVRLDRHAVNTTNQNKTLQTLRNTINNYLTDIQLYKILTIFLFFSTLYFVRKYFM